MCILCRSDMGLCIQDVPYPPLLCQLPIVSTNLISCETASFLLMLILILNLFLIFILLVVAPYIHCVLLRTSFRILSCFCFLHCFSSYFQVRFICHVISRLSGTNGRWNACLGAKWDMGTSTSNWEEGSGILKGIYYQTKSWWNLNSP